MFGQGAGAEPPSLLPRDPMSAHAPQYFVAPPAGPCRSAGRPPRLTARCPRGPLGCSSPIPPVAVEPAAHRSRRLGPLSPRPPPIFPASPLQLEVGPQDQGGPMVRSALKMQHRCPGPPLQAGDFDFYVSLLPTS